MTDFRAPIDQNKQMPENKAEAVVSPVIEPVKEAPVVTSQQTSAPVQNTEKKEWPLDRFLKKMVALIARMTGQPDPITGEKYDPTMSWNVAQKVWDTANKTIEKVGDVAKKTVEVTSNVTQKAVDITTSAVEKVWDVTQKAVETTTSAVSAVKEIKNDISNKEEPATQPLENLEKSE